MRHFSQFLPQVPFLASILNNQDLAQHNINHAPSISQQGSCPNPPSLSCPSTPSDSLNTCCVNHPSGHFLQTQFWDTSPSIGPNNSWTIHGLWPDLCTGGFDQFCDESRTHADIPSVIRRALSEEGSSKPVEELLEFMHKYWLSMDGNDAHLWSHEWNKHGTCISTLQPDCYPPPADLSISRHHHLDVLDYFIHTTSLFKTLDTYSILAEADILPSYEKRYALRELEDAVSSSSHGQTVTFRCRNGQLDEIWYHFSVMGSLRHSHTQSVTDSPFLNAKTVHKHFIPVPPDGLISNCPRRGIKYLPKLPHHERPAPSPTRTHSHSDSSSPPTSTSTSAPFTEEGHLEIHVLNPDDDQTMTEKKGCLIRHGEWYLSGTCATFRSKRDVVDPGHQPLFSLSSSYSLCLVDPTTSKFECTKDASVQGIFSSSLDDERVLAYRNESVFYAEKVPERWDKVDIYADDDGGRRSVQVEIQWISV